MYMTRKRGRRRRRKKKQCKHTKKYCHFSWLSRTILFRWSGKKSAFVWPQLVSCGGFSHHTHTHTYFTKFIALYVVLVPLSPFILSLNFTIYSSLAFEQKSLLFAIQSFKLYDKIRSLFFYLVVFCIYSMWPNPRIFRGQIYRFVLFGWIIGHLSHTHKYNYTTSMASTSSESSQWQCALFVFYVLNAQKAQVLCTFFHRQMKYKNEITNG